MIVATKNEVVKGKGAGTLEVELAFLYMAWDSMGWASVGCCMEECDEWPVQKNFQSSQSNSIQSFYHDIFLNSNHDYQ